jgi:hypothetical protein
LRRTFVIMAALLVGRGAQAGPETALREFNSSQIKKGVRALGMGGDGATVGNYALVYRDADSALADYGGAYFSDTGDQIHFVAVGATTPRFWNGAAFYVIAMAAWGSGLALHLTSPAFPHGADFTGDGSDQALFAKFAKPLGHGVAIGFLLGWERSALTATHGAGGASIAYSTTYLPSGGLGVTWDVTPGLLLGARALLNNDWETQTDAVATKTGWIHSWEARLGVAIRVWRGGLVDAGVVGLWRGAAIARTSTLEARLVAGFEQTSARRSPAAARRLERDLAHRRSVSPRATPQARRRVRARPRRRSHASRLRPHQLLGAGHAHPRLRPTPMKFHTPAKRSD